MLFLAFLTNHVSHNTTKNNLLSTNNRINQGMGTMTDVFAWQKFSLPYLKLICLTLCSLDLCRSNSTNITKTVLHFEQCQKNYNTKTVLHFEQCQKNYNKHLFYFKNTNSFLCLYFKCFARMLKSSILYLNTFKCIFPAAADITYPNESRFRINRD